MASFRKMTLVRARKATADDAGIIERDGGDLTLEEGAYIVTSGGSVYPCAADIFEKTYERAESRVLTEDGLLFRKSAMLEATRMTALCEPTVIKTLEGVESLNPGDWLATGVEGEQWVIDQEFMQDNYEPIDEVGQKMMAA